MLNSLNTFNSKSPLNIVKGDYSEFVLSEIELFRM
jgi:hypothetical protein